MTEQKELTRKDIKPTLKQKFEGAAIKTENLFDITTKVPAFVAAGVVASIFGPLVNTYNQIIKIGENAINNEGFRGKDFIDAMRSYVDNIEPYNRAAWKNVEKNIVDVLKQAQNRYKEYDHKVYVEPIEMAKRKKEELEEREQRKQAEKQYYLSPDRMKATGAETLESIIQNATTIEIVELQNTHVKKYPPLEKFLGSMTTIANFGEYFRAYKINEIMMVFGLPGYAQNFGGVAFMTQLDSDGSYPCMAIKHREQADYLRKLATEKATYVLEELPKEEQKQAFLDIITQKIDSNAK